jgi:hypothetical protein
MQVGNCSHPDGPSFDLLTLHGEWIIVIILRQGLTLHVGESSLGPLREKAYL